jgi:acetyl esterase/lipase
VWAQDKLTLKGSRRPLRGSVVIRTEEKVVFNPYFSTHAAMVFGVTEYPAKKVKSVERDLPPHEEFLIGFRKQKDSADELCVLADFCKRHHLKAERALALEQAMRRNPTHAIAIKAYTAHKAKRFLQLDPVANRVLGAAMRALLVIDDAAERSPRARKLIKEFEPGFKETYLARAYRSSKQPKGTHHKRPNTLRRDQVAFEYTLHVPDSYDPFTPAPLLVALHGGGPGGPTGVVGNGQQALTLYATELRDRDYIVVCPTAKAAPWSQPVNDAVVTTLLEEVRALYNIDENRVYLTGHSMGGYGTWHFGPKYCEDWAAIGPTAGGGSNGFKRLRDTQTFVFLFHGGDDTVVSPRDSRAAAAQMLNDGNDLVYTELPTAGHSLPDSVVREMLDFFERKRRIVRRRRMVHPESSFLRPESRDEKQYFGRLLPK